MNRLTLFLLCLLYAMSSLAQNAHPGLEYVSVLEADVNDINHSYYLRVNDSVIDDLGNLVVIGFFNGSIDMDPSPDVNLLTAAPVAPFDHPFLRTSSFIAKYSPNGRLIWARKLGDDGNIVRALHLNTDAENNIVVSGHYKYIVDFDLGENQELMDALSTLGNFVVSYDQDAGFNWVNQINSGSGYVEIMDVGIKNNGNPVVSGQFNGQIVFQRPIGEVVLTTGPANSFFGELNLSGEWLNARHVASTDNLKVNSMVLDSDDNVVLNLTENNVSYVLRRYLETTVGFQTILSLHRGENSAFTLSGMDIDEHDNIYLGGDFRGTILKSGSVFLNSSSPTDEDAFLVKVDTSNSVIWKKTIVPTEDGDTFPKKILLKQIEINSGEDSNEGLLIMGITNSVYSFGNGTVLPSSSPGFGAYIAKFKANGDAVHASVFEGYGNNSSVLLTSAHVNNDQILVVGKLKSLTDFDINPLSIFDVSIANGDPDVFFAKYIDFIKN